MYMLPSPTNVYTEELEQYLFKLMKIMNYKFWVEVLLYWSELTHIANSKDYEMIKDMI